MENRIKLTEEILEQIGAELDYDTISWCQVTYFFEGIEIYISMGNIFDCNGVEIEYLDEFQKIYFELKGKELKLPTCSK